MSANSGRPNRLFIIRHGESLRNEAKQGNVHFPSDESRRHIRGIGDHKIDLTPLGRMQARAAGIYLRENFDVPDYAYDSFYARTQQTADGALSAYTEEERQWIERRHNIFLRERDPGYTYDMIDEEVETGFPFHQEHRNTFGSLLFRPIGGESLADGLIRAYLLLQHIYEARDGQDVQLYGHGGITRDLMFLIEHWDLDQFAEHPGPDNCGITIYQSKMVPIMIKGKPHGERKKLLLERFNDTGWEKYMDHPDVIAAGASN